LVAAVALSAGLVPQTDTIIPLGSATRLNVEMLRGQVTVRTWERNELRIVADHSPSEYVEIERDDGTVRLDVGTEWGAPGSVEFDLTVPASLDMNIEGAWMAVDLEGVSGEVSVETVQGPVRLVGGRGFVKIVSVHGPVECRGAEGRIELEAVNAGVEVFDARGEITVSTVNGSITMRGIESRLVEANTMNGGVSYDGTLRDDGRYSFNTHNGDLSVAVPAGVNATVSVSTFSGGFESDFPLTLSQTKAGGKQFHFTIGTGGARIELESFGGSIRLRRP
jgi:DUF4097 and DUF4098 domain-containing protein YvlB